MRCDPEFGEEYDLANIQSCLEASRKVFAQFDISSAYNGQYLFSLCTDINNLMRMSSAILGGTGTSCSVMTVTSERFRVRDQWAATFYKTIEYKNVVTSDLCLDICVTRLHSMTGLIQGVDPTAHLIKIKVLLGRDTQQKMSFGKFKCHLHSPHLTFSARAAKITLPAHTRFRFTNNPTRSSWQS